MTRSDRRKVRTCAKLLLLSTVPLVMFSGWSTANLFGWFGLNPLPVVTLPPPASEGYFTNLRVSRGVTLTIGGHTFRNSWACLLPLAVSGGAWAVGAAMLCQTRGLDDPDAEHRPIP